MVNYWGNETNQVLDNYFYDDFGLLGLIYDELTDRIMRALIDDDYVLISPSARNRRLLSSLTDAGRVTSGFGWHTDSRYIGGGAGIRPSLCYMSIAAIDKFTESNGATHFLPKSHLFYERPPREVEIPYERLLLDRGDMAYIDTGLWHRIGDANHESR